MYVYIVTDVRILHFTPYFFCQLTNNILSLLILSLPMIEYISNTIGFFSSSTSMIYLPCLQHYQAACRFFLKRYWMQNLKYRGMFETQKSGNKTSSGDNGLNITTFASPKVGQDQVSGGVRVLCWHAAPVANVPLKPFAIFPRQQQLLLVWNVSIAQSSKQPLVLWDPYLVIMCWPFVWVTKFSRFSHEVDLCVLVIVIDFCDLLNLPFTVI